MKVLNLIWGFTTGGGIDKCFLTYSRIGEVAKDIEMVNVCISLGNETAHFEQLRLIGTRIIPIKSRTDFSWVKKLKAHIIEESPDILFSHGFNGAIVLWIERLFGAKGNLVFSYHGLYNPPTASRKCLSLLYNNLPVWIYRYVANKVVCVSDDSRRQLISRSVPAAKTRTVYNGISDVKTDVKVKMRDDVINIITCSRIDAIKGLNYLLVSLARLKSEGVGFHYYMIGEGPELEKLKTQCSELGLDGDVTFAGFQDNVAEWLNGADIFAITSLQENHSIAVLEAMRAGKAIVATEVGGNGESIRNEKEGLLVKAGDTESLYCALKSLICDEALRVKLSVAAQKRFKERFTERAMLENLAVVLRS